MTEQKQANGRNPHVIIVTDCGGSDRGRYEIAARRCFYPHNVGITFFETESMNTLHSGFTTAAHALSTVDFFGELAEGEFIGVLDNAAPRHGTENGKKLRGADRKREGEEIYALRLRNGAWVVGPNAGFNFHFIKELVVESRLVIDTSGRYTPFRSMEVMVPALAKIFGSRDFPYLQLEQKDLVVGPREEGVYVADWDTHGNIYLVSTTDDESWIPQKGESHAFRIGNKIARLRHVEGIFAGHTGEQTLTVGSLQLNGKPVYYIVVVGGNAHSLFGSPAVGTRVEIECD